MRDPRGARLADVVVRHSTEPKPGEAVVIEAFDVGNGLVLDLIDAAHAAGAFPLVSSRRKAITRARLRRRSEPLLRLQGAIEQFQMEKVQAYVGLRGAENISELSDVPGDPMGHYMEHVVKPVHLDYREFSLGFNPYITRPMKDTLFDEKIADGGEVWFDDERVRRDGRFVTPELEGLNPERLRA